MPIPHRALLEWLDEPPEDRGLHFAAAGDGWTFSPYASLAPEVLRVAAACTGRGVRDGDVVAIVQRSGAGFAASMFGAIAAGASSCAVAPPFAFQRAGEYERHLTHVFTVARPVLAIVDDDCVPAATVAAGRAGLPAPLTLADLVDNVGLAAGPRPGGEHALIQFTSGSSGPARAVRIPRGTLEANLTGMRRWLELTIDHVGATWLPVHHDMGLIGAFFNSVVTGIDLWMMSPEDFIRSPLRFLRCLSDQRVVHTPMPNFGLAYILRRTTPQETADLDLSALRAIILGAERIDADVLSRFEERFSPVGLRPHAMRPAYGGAEATLAVTGVPMGQRWAVSRPSAASGIAPDVVGCGVPLSGTCVTIADALGDPQPDGVIGEVVVSGSSVAPGYLGDPGTASATSISGGVLRTGDAGFIRDGHLFVLGRLGDGIKVRGQMVLAELIEAELSARGIPDRKAAVLLGLRDGEPTAVVVFEHPKPGWRTIAREVLAEHLEGGTLLCVAAKRGGIAITTSGKVRRRVMWQAFCAGTLVGETGPLADDADLLDGASRSALAATS
jgi:acyl-CoA synthetase (AMP-forming)/AMP-acid ligase II